MGQVSALENNVYQRYYRAICMHKLEIFIDIMNTFLTDLYLNAPYRTTRVDNVPNFQWHQCCRIIKFLFIYAFSIIFNIIYATLLTNNYSSSLSHSHLPSPDQEGKTKKLFHAAQREVSTEDVFDSTEIDAPATFP